MVSCSFWTIWSINASTVRADCATYPKSLSISWCFDIRWTGPANSWAALLLLYSRRPRGAMSLWVHLRVPKQQTTQKEDTDFSLAFLLHIFPNQLRHLFRKGLLSFGECVNEIAFNIEFGHQIVFRQNGNYHVRLHDFRSGKISRIVGYIIHHHGPARGSGGAAQSCINRNAYIGAKASDVRPHHQHAGVGLVHQIKSNPVVT